MMCYIQCEFKNQCGSIRVKPLSVIVWCCRVAVSVIIDALFVLLSQTL